MAPAVALDFQDGRYYTKSLLGSLRGGGEGRLSFVVIARLPQWRNGSATDL